MNKKQIFGKV